MDNVIGAKGGYNDRKRVMVITRNRLKKLKEYYLLNKKKKLEEKERKVRRLQVITFFKSVPLIFSLNTIKLIINNSKDIKNEEVKKDSLNKDNIKIVKKDFDNKKNNNNESNLILNKIVIKSKFILKNVATKNIDNNKENKNIVSTVKITNTNSVASNSVNVEENKILNRPTDNIKNNLIKTLPIVLLPLSVFTEKKINSDKDTKKSINKDIEKIKNKKIIEKYEKNLKELRTDFKEIISDYDLLEDNDLKNEDLAKALLESINLVIEKLDELKEKIKISDYGYEDYFYDLIEKYTDDFKNKRIVDDVVDSSLYISISEKLDVIDSKKDELKLKLEEKTEKHRLKNDKKDFEKDYFKFEEFNENLNKFQNKQETILKDLKKDIKETKNKVNMFLTKIMVLNFESIMLLSLISTASMRRPSVRNTKAVAISTLVGIYYMNQIIKDKDVSFSKKKVFEEKYKKEIESNINDIDDVFSLINVTSDKINSLIENVITTFGEYKELEECQELLSNLENIKRKINEKKYEMVLIKEKQAKLLNHNKVKIKEKEN